MARNSSSSLGSLLGLVFLYVFILALLLVLSVQVLEGVEFQQNAVLWVILGIALLLPLVLIAAVIIRILRLVRERRRGHPGSRFRYRMLASFVVIVLISAIPQAVLSFNFVRVAVSTWFRPGMGQALEAGLDMTIDYYQQEVRRLEQFAASDLLDGILVGAASEPDRIIQRIRQVRPELSAVQLVAANGVILGQWGGPSMLIPAQAVLQEADGRIVRYSLENHDIVRIKRSFQDGGRRVVVLLTLEISPEFEDRARIIQENVTYFNQFSRNQATFTFAVLFFYLLFALPLLLVAVLASFYFSDEIIRPIMNLEVATQRIAQGDFSYRILTRGNEDIDHLAESFNRMILELDRSRQKLVHSERIAAWKDLAQRLAHEIKNPLTPIKLSTERLIRKYESSPETFRGVLEQSVSRIITEVDRLSSMLTEFRNFARLPNPEPSWIPFSPFAESLQGMYSGYANLRIEVSVGTPDLHVFADERQLRQVLGNLLANAVDAIGERSGMIKLGAFKVQKSGISYCRITVEDDGPGIAEEHRDKIFTPYYTSKKDGTGLGLAIVERIISDHLGQIWFESTEHHGTRFYIDLPDPMDEQEGKT